MTIALLIKVNDGLVVASDSATTLSMRLPDGGEAVANTYNNANKVFNLHKALPIGAMTWGLGNIGPVSIATLAKDLRRRYTGGDRAHADWSIDPESYDMGSVASRAQEFLYDERYCGQYGPGAVDAGIAAPQLGFLVAGYSSDSDEPQAFVLEVNGPGSVQLTEVLAGDTGASWWGQPEAIARFLGGMSLAVPNALVNLNVGLGPDEARAVASAVQQQINPQMVSPAMPIQDAIDLAEFLVHLTIQYVRFSPGPPTVGGPIEIATITKHEGLKWVRRKHYFESRLNPVAGG